MGPQRGNCLALARAALVACALLASGAATAQATFSVTSLADDGSPGTLRAAISSVNAQCTSTLFGQQITIALNVAGSIDLLGTQGPLPEISCSRTRVVGNLGTNGLPTVLLNGVALVAGPNPGHGLSFVATSSDNEVTGVAVGNFPGVGIRMASSTSKVTSSHVGVGLDGESVAANQSGGIELGPGSVAEGNIVAGNTGPGIRVVGDNAIVRNNLVGLTRSEAALGNQSAGIAVGATIISANETPSAGTLIIGNTVGANGTTGIDVGQGPNTTIQGNFIGLNGARASRPNGSWGVFADFSQGVRVGGSGTGEGNVIAFNRLCGVAATSQSATDEAVEISRNEIFANGAIVGATRGIARFNCSDPNAVTDPNPIPKNFAAPTPGIASVKYSGVGTTGTVLTWRAAGLPVIAGLGPQVTVEFFGNPTSVNGFDQGEKFVGSCPTVAIDGAGNATCTSPRLDGLVANPTATATRDITVTRGTFPNTSEFSPPLVTPTANNLSLALGPAAVGARTAAGTVTFTNPSTINLTVASIVSSDAAEVVVDTATTTCVAGTSPTVLAPNQSCTVGIALAPQNGGLRNGTLTLTLSDTQAGTDFIFEVAVNGTGTTASLTPAIGWSTTTVPAGGALNLTLQVGNGNAATASSVRTLSSVSTAPFAIAGAGIFGGGCAGTPAYSGAAGGTSFDVQGLTIASAGSCTVTVPLLAPSTPGTYAVSVLANALSGQVLQATVASSAAASPNVTVTAVNPALTVSPSSLVFGTVGLGLASAPQRLTVTNTGGAALTLSAPVLIVPTHFTVLATSCAPGSLAVSAACTIDVAFEPRLAGALSGVLAVNSTDAGSAAVTMLGNGQAQPLSLDLGLSNTAVKVGDTASLTLALRNSNAAALLGVAGSLLPLPSGLAINGTPSAIAGTGCAGSMAGNPSLSLAGVTVPANGTCTFSVPIQFRLAGPVSYQQTAGALNGTVLDETVTNALSNALSIAVAPPDLIAASVATTPATGILGERVRVIYGFDNPNAAPFNANGNFQANVPAGLAVASPANASLSAGCAGVATPTPTGVTLSGLGIPTGGRCELAFDVVSSLTGQYSLQVAAGALVGTILSSPASNAASAALAFTVTRAPQAILVVTPAGPVGFGSVQVGAASAPVAITLTNVGGRQLVFPAGAFVTTGDFRLLPGSTCRGSPLDVLPNPTAECVLSVDFAPQAVGVRTGSLTIASSGGNVTVALDGTGAATPLPDIAVTPVTVDFGPQQVGSASPIARITVANLGTAPLAVSRLFARGDFSFTSDCGPAPVASKASCNIDAVFSPLVPGPRVGGITVTTNDPDTPQLEIVLRGEGVAAPAAVLTLSPGSIAFPDTVVGQRSPALSSTLTNTGSAPSTLTGFTLAGSGFNFAQDCPAALAPGASCTITAQFLPTAATAFAADVLIASDAAGSPAILPLTGRGISSGVGQLAAEPPSLAFGDQVLGTVSGARPLFVRNVGTRAVAVTSIGTTGDYQASGGCARLEPQGTCTLTVTFFPQALGERVGSVVVTSDAPGGVFRVAASGRGIANPAPRLSLSASSLAFGNTLVGFGSSRPITLTNTGDLPLSLNALTADGDLTVRSDCPAFLAPGKACTVTVGFQPRVAGARGGNVVIESNDPASPARLAATGTGCRFGLTGRGFALFCTP